MSTWLVNGYYGPPTELTGEQFAALIAAGCKPETGKTMPEKPVPEPRETRIARGEKVPEKVWVIVDIEGADDEDTDDAAIDAAFELVVGSDYTIEMIQPLLTGAIPFACRNVLFTSEKQLHARVPDLYQAFPEDDENEPDQ